MIAITETGPVATISVPDYALLTGHDIAFGLALRDAVRDTADRDEIKAIVLRADGPDFAPPVPDAALDAAADLRAGSGRTRWHAAYAAPSGLYQNMVFCRKVIVTAVNGRCAGAGSMLVLCSDFTVCDDDASFASPFDVLPEANLVLAALTVRLNRAKSWLLGGQAWDAEKARHAGLINRVAARADVERIAHDMAAAAAQMPLDGLAMTRILFEAFLDTQGVGQDFDMAELYAGALQACRAAGTAGQGTTA